MTDQERSDLAEIKAIVQNLDTVLRGDGTKKNPGIAGRMSHLEERDEAAASARVIEAANHVFNVVEDDDPDGGYPLYNYLKTMKKRHDLWFRALMGSAASLLASGTLYIILKGLQATGVIPHG